MFKIDTRSTRELERDLKRLSSKALPFAIRGTQNAKAFQTMKEAKEIVTREFTLRNKFTKRSIQFESGKHKATVGSIAPYMATQEFGGTKKKKGKTGVAIATSYSSGEGENAKPRKKMPKPRNRMKNINFTKARLKAKSKGQELLLLARAAIETNQRVLFYDDGRQRKGIYRVLGGRLSKSGWPKGAKIRMLHDLSETSVTIKKEPWLLPASMKVQKRTEQIYKEQLIRQIELQRLFIAKRRR